MKHPSPQFLGPAICRNWKKIDSLKKYTKRTRDNALFASDLNGRHIYFRYNATSGDIVDNTAEQLDLENMGRTYSRWSFVRRCCGTRDNRGGNLSSTGIIKCVCKNAFAIRILSSLSEDLMLAIVPGPRTSLNAAASCYIIDNVMKISTTKKSKSRRCCCLSMTHYQRPWSRYLGVPPPLRFPPFIFPETFTFPYSSSSEVPLCYTTGYWPLL